MEPLTQLEADIAAQQQAVEQLRQKLTTLSGSYPWQGLELKTPQALTDLANLLNTFTTTVDGILALVTEALDFIKLLDGALVNPVVAALKAALTAIDTAVETLQQSVGVYTLIVPPVVPEEIGPALRKAVEETGYNLERSIPRAAVDALTEALPVVPELGSILPLIRTAQGGNIGFMRTVLESIYDQNDLNRPQLKPSDYVAVAYLVGFATNPVALLQLVEFFRLLTGKPVPITGGVPAPTGIHLAPSNPGVLLKWARQSPTFANLGVYGWKIDKVYVVRTTAVAVTSKRDAQSVFFTSNLALGVMEGGVTEVIAEFNHTTAGLVTSQYSDRTELENGKAYYYAVCFSAPSPDGNKRALGPFSNWVRYYVDEDAAPAPPSGRGADPNWIFGPMLSSYAALDDTVKSVKRFTRSVKRDLDSTGSQVSDYIDQVVQEGQYYQRRAAEINTQVKKIQQLLAAANQASLHVRIAHGSGGNTFLLSDLTKAFDPTNPDPLAPRYTADELSTGIVLVAAAPGPALIAPFLTFLQGVFGGAGALVSQLDQVLASLDVVVSSFEQQAVDDAPSTGTSLGAIKIGEDDPGHCVPVTTPAVIFGDDLAPV
jgi:hypothetical protein